MSTLWHVPGDLVGSIHSGSGSASHSQATGLCAGSGWGDPGAHSMSPCPAACEDTVPPTRVWPAPCRSPEKALVLQETPGECR